MFELLRKLVSSPSTNPEGIQWMTDPWAAKGAWLSKELFKASGGDVQRIMEMFGIEEMVKDDWKLLRLELTSLYLAKAESLVPQIVIELCKGNSLDPAAVNKSIWVGVWNLLRAAVPPSYESMVQMCRDYRDPATRMDIFWGQAACCCGIKNQPSDQDLAGFERVVIDGTTLMHTIEVLRAPEKIIKQNLATFLSKAHR